MACFVLDLSGLDLSGLNLTGLYGGLKSLLTDVLALDIGLTFLYL